MFNTLHDLAKKATLMITVAAEGDDQLRVNVTPIPADTKAKANLPPPLSLLATPAEFDTDFGAALSTWHAPKRSLIQQAQDASGGVPALPAPKSEAKSDSKAEKPGRKPRASKVGEDEKKGDAVAAAAAAAGEAVAEADEAMGATADDNANAADAAAAAEHPADAAATQADQAVEVAAQVPNGTDQHVHQQSADAVSSAAADAAERDAEAPAEQHPAPADTEVAAPPAPAPDQGADTFTLNLF